MLTSEKRKLRIQNSEFRKSEGISLVEGSQLDVDVALVIHRRDDIPGLAADMTVFDVLLPATAALIDGDHVLFAAVRTAHMSLHRVTSSQITLPSQQFRDRGRTLYVRPPVRGDFSATSRAEHSMFGHVTKRLCLAQRAMRSLSLSPSGTRSSDAMSFRVRLSFS